MTQEAILIALVSSLLSGLIGVAVSSWFFYRLERHKLKLDLARRLLGHRYSITGDHFSAAMNEVFVVFADSKDVLQKMERLYETLQTPGKPNADGVFTDFLKAVCKNAGLSQATLNDQYFIKTFNARN